jgi:transposase
MPFTEILPRPGTKRWVVRRKAAVVTAVRGGMITIDEACRAYQLSEEEFLSWERAFEKHGLAGLRTTRVQDYRARQVLSEQPLDPLNRPVATTRSRIC